jgi:hypothetical protein
MTDLARKPTVHDQAPINTSPLPWRVALAVTLAACGGQPAPVVAPPPVQVQTTIVHDTVQVQVRDPDSDRQSARLLLRLIENQTLVDQLQTRLEDARDEVVRTMAKLQTLASRAEAASAIAESDVALRSLRTTAGNQPLPEINQAAALVQQSNVEFGKQNFGGALYLANQAKTIAAAGRARAAAGSGTAVRPGETQFATPIRIKTSGRGNIREGPGTSFAITFAVAAGDQLTAYSFTDDWVRVSDDSGRTGWIFRSLVAHP